MEHSADTNVVDDNKDTPLLVACKTGHSECLKLLLGDTSNKPYVNSVDNAGETGVMLASKNGHIECLKLLLLNKEVDLLVNNLKGENALMLATEWNHVECTRALLEHNMNPNAGNFKMGRSTALYIACLQGHADIVKLLTEFNANVNSLQVGRITPLMCAAKKNHAQCVQLLLDANADGNMGDNEGVTAAMMASFKGSNESLALLLEAGVDINACDIYGGNCLRHAISGKNWKCLDLLLAYGAFVKSIFNVYSLCGDDPDVCDKLTGLFYAAGGHNYIGEEETVAEEKRKADREERENDKETIPLYEQCKEYITSLLAKKYPTTNLFPLIKSLPVPKSLKRLLLNGVTLDIEVPLQKVLKCISYECTPLICAMCLRSKAELMVEDLTLELCSTCQVVAYCSERCERNHWVMAHMAACSTGTYYWLIYYELPKYKCNVHSHFSLSSCQFLEL